MKISYLNTDLEIKSKEDISRIIEEFGEHVIVLHHEEAARSHEAVFEAASELDGADDVINHFCGLVENLAHDARTIWDRCRTRIFDIGYESGTTPHNLRSEIKASTIQRLSAVGASIIITIYSLQDDTSSDETGTIEDE